jgi:hypothetical protein
MYGAVFCSTRHEQGHTPHKAQPLFIAAIKDQKGEVNYNHLQVGAPPIEDWLDLVK